MSLRDRKTPLTDAIGLTYSGNEFANAAINLARRLEQERDAAVEALTKLCTHDLRTHQDIADAWDSARAVLAEIEGEKG